MKISILSRILLLLSAVLAAYQVAIGVEGLTVLPMSAYTLGFGVLLVAGLLLMILGYEALESPIVVIIATLIPLSLSLGLIWEHLPNWQVPYLIFAVLGFLVVVVTRLVRAGRLATILLAIVHGVAGLVIFILPIVDSLSGRARPGFALVGLGGALIGLGGLMLSFLKAGRPVLPRLTVLKVLPWLLFLMTAAFVAGFALG